MTATLALAYHNLSTLLAAGVPLLRSLDTTAESLDRRLAPAFRQLSQAASQGDPLAQTMAKKPNLFGPTDVMIVRAAETSGTLPESLALLAKWHEFQQSIKRKMLSGMMLPIIMIHAAAFLAPLPGFFLGGWHVAVYIRQVISILLLFYIPAAVVFAIMHFAPRTGILRAMFDRSLLRIPVLGKAVYNLALSRYCWVFHMLTKAGLPITECAEQAAGAAGNDVVTDQVRGGTASAKAGRPVSAGFSTRLPTEFVNLWQVGEETGKLEDAAKRLADNIGNSADFMFGEFAAWLPRMIYFLVCAVIAYFIIRNLALISRSFL
jgi:type IV pilus assembly protein PilC